MLKNRQKNVLTDCFGGMQLMAGMFISSRVNSTVGVRIAGILLDIPHRTDSRKKNAKNKNITKAPHHFVSPLFPRVFPHWLVCLLLFSSGFV